MLISISGNTRPRNILGWMNRSLLKRHFLPPDLLPELVKAGLDGTVAVQARQSLEESRWLLELSDQYSGHPGCGWMGGFMHY